MTTARAVQFCAEVNPGRLKGVGIVGPREWERQRLTRLVSEHSFLIPAWRFEVRWRLVGQRRDGIGE